MQRRKVLGPDFTPEEFLSRKGDATRGRSLFAGVCIACHRVNDTRIDFEPDLSHIATKWNRAAMIEQLFSPSKIIDPKWQITTVELKNGLHHRPERHLAHTQNSRRFH